MSASNQARQARTVLRCVAALLCVLAIAAAHTPALCQQASREQEQLRRLRQQVQQLQQEQVNQQDAAQRANAGKAAAKAQLDTAQAQLDATQSALRHARSAAAAQTQTLVVAQKELETARREHTALQARLDQLQGELQSAGRGIDKLRADGTGVQLQLAAASANFTDLNARHALQAQGLQTCIANNQALRDIGLELVQRYANKGVSDVLAHNEPFTQIQRVALENLLQGYQDKLDALAFTTSSVPATPPGESRNLKVDEAPRVTPEPARAP